MSHLLDNAIWHALTGPQARFASGHGLARHYDPEVSPFCAVAEASAAAFVDLASSLPAGADAVLFRPAVEPAFPGWEAIRDREIIQMAAESVPAEGAMPEPLGDDDVKAMLGLTALTQPGPFRAITFELGGYVGFRRGGALIAMGGERFRLPGFVELSAICVHPDVRGEGLGFAVVAHLTRRAFSQGDTPFLHVFPDNPALALYRRLGFRERARAVVSFRRRVAIGGH